MRVYMHHGFVLAACLSTTVVGCKESADEKGDLIAKKTIGPMGGTLSGGGITLDVPANALTADTDFELRTSTRDLSARDFQQDGSAYSIGPEGLILRLPAELSFDGGPGDPAVLFVQDGLTVAAMGSSAWINELSTIAIAKAGMQLAMVAEPPLGESPDEAGASIRDLAHFKVGLTQTPTFNVAYTLYDTQQAYDKPLNGSGDGDCGFTLGAVMGGSLASGCSDGPLTAAIRVTSADIEYDVTPFQAGKLDTPVVVGMVGGADDLAYQLGFFTFDTSPCYAETCSGYGTCEVAGDQASCTCNDGYAPGDELTCVCVPNCTGKECGGDNCGGDCAPGCGDNEYCDDTGHCQPNGGDTTGTTDPTDPTTTDPSTTSDGSTTDPSTTGTTDTGGSTTTM
jgi:hypothetical protein